MPLAGSDGPHGNYGLGPVPKLTSLASQSHRHALEQSARHNLTFKTLVALILMLAWLPCLRPRLPWPAVATPPTQAELPTAGRDTTPPIETGIPSGCVQPTNASSKQLSRQLEFYWFLRIGPVPSTPVGRVPSLYTSTFLGCGLLERPLLRPNTGPHQASPVSSATVSRSRAASAILRYVA
jgi:hypothetical protein